MGSKDQMIMKRSFFLFIFFIQLVISASSQEDVVRKWELSGYIKDLQSAFVVDNTINPFGGRKIVIADNLIHNRLNLRYYPVKNWVLRLEARNRLFWGDQPRLSPLEFRQQLDGSNDYFDLSLEDAWDAGFAYQFLLDRAYLEFQKNKWEVRFGRQRVNWGISTVWNPNDLFNAYNFTDFDYEERPGSDAIRIRYYSGFASSIEVSVQAADQFRKATIAGLWKFHLGSYDFQVLAGTFQDDLSLGGGWSGYIGDAGFKGEFTWFHPIEDGSDGFALTFNMDYQFENALYLNAGFLYNQLGKVRGGLGDLFDFRLSAKNLYPFRYAVFYQNSYPFTPLFNGSLAVIYSPVEAHAIFLNPAVTCSLSQNFDLDLVGQLIFQNTSGNFNSPVQAVFLRGKWSY